MPGGMDCERTSELAYPAKLLLNPLVSEREVSYPRGNVPVSLRTRRNCFLIRWFLKEKLAMPGGIDSERTSELAYPAKLHQIRWFLREKLAMPGGIQHSRSVNVPGRLCTRRNCFLIRWFLREKLAMPEGMDCERTSEFA